jgi:hypothetical protein
MKLHKDLTHLLVLNITMDAAAEVRVTSIAFLFVAGPGGVAGKFLQKLFGH